MEAACRHPRHETGTWHDEGVGVYCGWASFSGSLPRSRLPLPSARSHTTLFLWGDDFATDAAQKQDKPGAFPGQEYVSEVGSADVRFPARLNGRFHGLVIDQQRGLATLFNDRFGLQRLYYYDATDTFYFAAEAKAILAVCPELRRLDLRGLGELVTCGCVLEDRTLFAGLGVLPPASRWTIRKGVIESRESYFDSREWEQHLPLAGEDFYQYLREVFVRRLPHYFSGDQRIAMSLTGGLDTRMIMAWHRAAPGSLACYSFGSMFRDCADVRVARRVAQTCGQSHRVIPIAGGFLNRFADYARRVVHLTDGCADVSHAADLYANEQAAQIAPIRMTGNYGGEVLRQVRAFRPIVPAPGCFVPELNEYFTAALMTFEKLTRCHPLSFVLFRQVPYHHFGMLAVEQTQILVRSPFLDNEFVAALYRAPETSVKNIELSCRLIADGNAALARIPTDRGLNVQRAIGRGVLPWTELNFGFKAEYAYDYGMPGWLAKIDHSLSQLHLERMLLGRHKFKHYRYWYKTFLSDSVRELLLDSRALSRSHVERRTVERLVEGHIRGGKNYTTELHKLLTLELIWQTLID